MSQFKTKAFKDLKNKWYEKLSKNGFVDIESPDGDEQLDRWDSHYYYERYTPDRFAAKHDYYVLATEFLTNYRFETKLERKIWELHSDGMTFRDIAERLRKKGYRINKDRVNKEVLRMAEIMKIGLYHTDDV